MFKNQKSVPGTAYTAGLIQSIQALDPNQIATKQMTGLVLAAESLEENKRQSLLNSFDHLRSSLESMATNLGFAKADSFTQAQFEAGAAAGLLAGDFRTVITNKLSAVNVGTESMAVVAQQAGFDGSFDRAFGLEAYDERDNRSATLFSIAYNMQCAKQDEFGETLFPTIVIAPDQAGIGINVNLLLVYDALERRISGEIANFAKKNVIRAVVDPDILRKDATKAVPVVRPESAAVFVPAAKVAPRVVKIDAEDVTTAPLAFGKKVDFIGLSAVDSLLSAGVMDMTDSLDPAINLTSVYVEFGNDVVRFDVSNLPYSNFVFSVQNNYRQSNLTFETTSVLLNKASTKLDGSALDTLAGIVTDDLTIRLSLTVTGTVNIETGDTVAYCNHIGVHSVRKNGEELALTDATVAPIVAAIEAGKGLGYEILAYRSNANRRQRGQLVDQTRYTQFYNVPLRSPICTLHPTVGTGVEDTSDVEALMLLTRVRIGNEAVTALLNAAEVLGQYIDSRDPVGIGPDVLGVSRFFVRPTFFQESIDMNHLVDSINSNDRIDDMHAALINKIRDYAYRMYRDSEYKPAADALSGGLSPAPEVIIATDPVLARYLMISGDMRTLGAEFKCRIISTFDKRFAGKIAVTFGIFDENRNAAPNVLNFGNMIWAPEVVLVGAISRNNTINKETTVQPRYLFITHLPVMTMLQVSNVPDVFNRIPLQFKNV